MTTPAVPDDLLAAEFGGELQRALAAFMDWTLREWRLQLANVEKRQAGYVSPSERDELAALREHTRFALDAFARIGRDGAGRLDHLTPRDLGWHDLAAEMTRDEAAGRALVERTKRAARDELAIGAIGAATVAGYHSRPWDRAQYYAVRNALADGLAPRNGMEWLLLDGMAEAWAMHLHWLNKHTDLESLDAYRVEQDVRARDAWQPPRLGEAATVDRAALMADRFLRQFLRLMKTYRDGRKIIGSVVMTGGQLNVGEQQVIAGRAARVDAPRPTQTGVRRPVRIRRRRAEST